MLTTLLAGLGVGLSLIVAIGAQNLFVLRQGLRREHVLVVAAICAVSDAMLIALGVSGVGLALQTMPWLIDAVRWAGALFLGGYGLLAARRAWHPGGRALTGAPSPSPTRAEEPATGATATRVKAGPAVLVCLALTWLNPHVYLDTVFLLGSVANTYGAARWVFAGGAMAASLLWFFALALGARFLGPLLGTPRAWRVLDAVVAVVMIAIAARLMVAG